MLSNSSTTTVLIVIGIAGAILFVIGTLLRREGQARTLDAKPVPVEAMTQPAVDVETRLDVVERLAMVGQPWCIKQLNQIRDNDPDEHIREAADAALLVIGSRKVS